MRAAFALFVALLVAGSARAQTSSSTTAPVDDRLERVLKYVPDDTHLLVVIPNLEDLSNRLAAFGRASGIPELAEASATRLLQDTLGTGTAAVEPRGPVVLTISATHSEPLLIATLAKDAWTPQTQPVPLSDGVVAYELGEAGVIGAKDGVGVFAREKHELRRAFDSTGKAVAAARPVLSPLLNDHQLAIYVDVPAWREAFGISLDLVCQTMFMGMAAAGPDAEIGIALWRWIFDQVRRVVSETNHVSLAVRVMPDGFQARGEIQLQAESATAKRLTGITRPGRDLLRGLRSESAPMIVAFEWEDAAGVETLNEVIARALFDTNTLRSAIGAEKLEEVLRRSSSVNRRMPGSSVVLSTSPARDGLMYWGLYLTRDGEHVYREMRSLCELTPEILNAWGTMPDAEVKLTNERIAGHEVDVYQFNLDAAGTPMEPMMTAIYGKSPTLYMTPHPEGVLYTFGPREPARARLIDLLAEGGTPLRENPRVAAALGHLAPDAQVLLLMDLPTFTRDVMKMVEQMGMPAPPLVIEEKDGPFIGAGLYLQAQSIRGELYVPAEPLRRLIEAGRKLEDATEQAY